MSNATAIAFGLTLNVDLLCLATCCLLLNALARHKDLPVSVGEPYLPDLTGNLRRPGQWDGLLDRFHEEYKVFDGRDFRFLPLACV